MAVGFLGLFVSIVGLAEIILAKEKETAKGNEIGAPAKTETAVTPPEIDKKKEEELKAKALAIEKAKETLSKQQWTIELYSSTGKKGKPERDVLTFSDGKISSKNLSSEGYSATNYTLTIQEDKTIVWETMQTNEKAGVVFWRGELRDNVMRGMLSIRPLEKEPQDFSFISIIEEEKTKPEEKAPEAITKEDKPQIKEKTK